MSQFAKDLETGVDFLSRQRLQALGTETFDRERSHDSAIEKSALEHFAIQLLLRSYITHESTGKGIARTRGVFDFFDRQGWCAERMTSDSERSFAEKDCRAVLAVLNDQRLRSQREDFVRRARQVGFTGEHLGFRVVDQKDIHQLQGFG